MGAVAGLVVLVAIIPIVTVVAVFERKGGIFVRCERVSEGKRIMVWKFRTMIPNAHEMREKLRPLNERADGPFFKMKDDPRITRFGKILRKTRIDELPQIINVLLGEMALVGPRPHEPGEISAYPENFAHLPLYRAGITGLSQVSGASSLYWIKELDLDNDYLKEISPKKDIGIVLRTIDIIVRDPSGV